MATGTEFVTDALTRLGIRASETSLQPDEIQDGLRLLNDMMAGLEPTLQIGFSPIANASDEVRIPRFADGAIKDRLAIRMAPEYSRPVSNALISSAKGSWKDMLIAITFIGDVDYPSTLPQGSGNECHFGDDLDSRFFPEKNKRNF